MTRAHVFAFLHRRLSTMSQTIPPILSVLPTRALVDEKFKVLVENLPAGSPVTLHSLHHSEDKDYWEAYAHYISDHKGTVSGGFSSSLSQTYFKPKFCCLSSTSQLVCLLDILYVLFSCCWQSIAFVVAEDLSFGGTYTGIEPMGLLWSMRLVSGSQKGLR